MTIITCQTNIKSRTEDCFREVPDEKEEGWEAGGRAGTYASKFGGQPVNGAHWRQKEEK